MALSALISSCGTVPIVLPMVSSIYQLRQCVRAFIAGIRKSSSGKWKKGRLQKG
jgi:hypothetical protein